MDGTQTVGMVKLLPQMLVGGPKSQRSRYQIWENAHCYRPPVTHFPEFFTTFRLGIAP